MYRLPPLQFCHLFHCTTHFPLHNVQVHLSTIPTQVQLCPHNPRCSPSPRRYSVTILTLHPSHFHHSPPHEPLAVLHHFRHTHAHHSTSVSPKHTATPLQRNQTVLTPSLLPYLNQIRKPSPRRINVTTPFNIDAYVHTINTYPHDYPYVSHHTYIYFAWYVILMSSNKSETH